MITPAEYRHYAEECLRWAREAKTDTERQQFLEMAQTWTLVASRQDNELPIAPDPTKH